MALNGSIKTWMDNKKARLSNIISKTWLAICNNRKDGSDSDDNTTVPVPAFKFKSLTDKNHQEVHVGFEKKFQK